MPFICTDPSNMTNVLAAEPHESCNSDGREASAELCYIAYKAWVTLAGLLKTRQCVYDAEKSKCTQASVVITCPPITPSSPSEPPPSMPMPCSPFSSGLEDLAFDTSDTKSALFPLVDAQANVSRVFAQPGLDSSLQLQVEGRESTTLTSVGSLQGLAPVTHVRAVLRTSRVYESRPDLLAAFQVFDAQNNTRTARPVVFLRVSLLDGRSMRTSCGSPNAISGVGMCELRLGVSFFGVADQNVSLSLEVDGAVLAPDFAVALLTRVPANEWTGVVTSNVLGVQLPEHPIYLSEAFDVSLLARSVDPTATRARIDGFRLVLMWSPADALEVVSTTPTSWVTYSYNDETAGQLGVVGGTIKEGSEASTQGEEIELLVLRMRATQPGSISVTVRQEQIVSQDSAEIGGLRDDTPVLDGRDGSNTVGLIQVVSASRTALFAFADGGWAQLANWGVITGQYYSRTVRALVVYDEPGKANSQPATVCSLRSGSATMAAACVVQAGEAHGAGPLEVSVQSGEVAAVVHLHVYAPSRVQLHVSDRVLTVVGDVCGAGTLYQSARVRVDADGLDVSLLDGVALHSNDTSVVSVDGVYVRGVSSGVATLSLLHQPSVGAQVLVENVPTPPQQLVVRVLTSVGASLEAGLISTSAEQSFRAEGDTGFLYAWAVYANGDRHPVDAALNVTSVSPSLEYASIGGRRQVRVAADAVASTCGESLLRVGLLACGTEVSGASVPIQLDLPRPVSAAIQLSEDWLAPETDLATHGALRGSAKHVYTATVSTAAVSFDDGSTPQSMLHDARVSLQSSDASCAIVSPTLHAANRLPGGGQVAIVAGATCDRVTVTATFSLGGGSFVLVATAEVRIARFVSMQLMAHLYPEPVTPLLLSDLRYIDCTGVHQRASLSSLATVSRGTDNVTGRVDLNHGGIAVSETSTTALLDLQGHTRVHVATSSLRGIAQLQATLNGEGSAQAVALLSLGVSYEFVRLTGVAPSTMATLFGLPGSTQGKLGLEVTFEHLPGFSYSYPNLQTLVGDMGIAASQLLEFESDAAAASVNRNGQLRLHENHPQAVSLSATSKCDAAVRGSTSAFANLKPAESEVDLGSEFGLQFSPVNSLLTVDVWLKPRCDVTAFSIEIFYSDGELFAIADPSGTLPDGLVEGNAQSGQPTTYDVPAHFNQLAKLVGTGFTSFRTVTRVGVATFDVLGSGNLTARANYACGSLTISSTGYTAATGAFLADSRRRLDGQPVGPSRVLAESQIRTYGDVNDDGSFDSGDLSFIVAIFNELSWAMTTEVGAWAIQQRDCNYDGDPGKWQDVQCLLRILGNHNFFVKYSATPPVAGTTEPMSIDVWLFNAVSMLVIDSSAVLVSAELQYSVASAALEYLVGSVDADEMSSAQTKGPDGVMRPDVDSSFALLALSTDHYTLRVRPAGSAWNPGSSMAFALIIDPLSDGSRPASGVAGVKKRKSLLGTSSLRFVPEVFDPLLRVLAVGAPPSQPPIPKPASPPPSDPPNPSLPPPPAFPPVPPYGPPVPPVAPSPRLPTPNLPPFPPASPPAHRLCNAPANMTYINAVNPPESCNSIARRKDPDLCNAAYKLWVSETGIPTVRPCMYDEADVKCTTSPERIICPLLLLSPPRMLPHIDSPSRPPSSPPGIPAMSPPLPPCPSTPDELPTPPRPSLPPPPTFPPVPSYMPPVSPVTPSPRLPTPNLPPFPPASPPAHRLCNAPANMTNINAVNPPESCNSIARRKDPDLCNAAYKLWVSETGIPTVRPCMYDEADVKCTTSPERIICPMPLLSPPKMPPHIPFPPASPPAHRLCNAPANMTNINAVNPPESCNSIARRKDPDLCNAAYKLWVSETGIPTVRPCMYDEADVKCTTSPERIICPLLLLSPPRMLPHIDSPSCPPSSPPGIPALSPPLPPRPSTPDELPTPPRPSLPPPPTFPPVPSYMPPVSPVTPSPRLPTPSLSLPPPASPPAHRLCNAPANMTNINAVNPPESCNSIARRKDPDLCNAAYKLWVSETGIPTVRPCMYDEADVKCTTSPERIICPLLLLSPPRMLPHIDSPSCPPSSPPGIPALVTVIASAPIDTRRTTHASSPVATSTAYFPACSVVYASRVSCHSFSSTSDSESLSPPRLHRLQRIGCATLRRT